MLKEDRGESKTAVLADIPFNRACSNGNELAYMTDAIERGHIAGDGPYTKRVERLLETELGVDRVLLTTSCTHALEMSALLIGIQPGDEVIVPSFTFVSTVNAFVLRGAKPVFVDIRPDTLNMDERLVSDLITDRTRAIFAVHYAGIACEMDEINALAGAKNIPVIEDNAQGLFARYKGRPLGSLGSLAALSFHETKNFTCGEGGALLINDPAYIEGAEIIREKGTNRSRFIRGQVDKYTWVDVGSSYVLSDMLAAFLCAQLEAHERITAHRRDLSERYFEGLASWSDANGATLPYVPEHCEQPYHMFYALMPSEEQRDALIQRLRGYGIQSVFHYLPLHLSGKGEEYGYRRGDLPVTEDVSARLVRLPFHNALDEYQQRYVIDAIVSGK